MTKTLQIVDVHDLGKFIRQARKAQGLTQEELAGLSGTGRRLISDVEEGKEKAQIGKILLLIRALGIKLDASIKWGD